MNDHKQHKSFYQAGRGIYLLPNLLTTASMFAGFYAIVSAMKGLFEPASIAIFVAMVADGLDGRVARMTNTQSPFGAEYDSLSDMISFGLAPALMMYSWSLQFLGKFGWFVAFLYTAATALRLARFNVQLQDEDKQYFKGLSCTSAAGVIAGTLWLALKYDISGSSFTYAGVALVLFVAAMMVSTIRYYSFKTINRKDKISFMVAVIGVLVIAAIAMEPAEILFVLFIGYLFSGPIVTLWKLRRARRQRHTFKF